jgi:type IV secretory pathway VirB9-like protein
VTPLRALGLFVVPLSLVAGLVGCEPKEPPGPPVAPPPEDLSMWTLPELVQVEPPPPRPVVVPPVRVPAGPAEQVVPYGPGMVVEVLVAVGSPFDIILEAGEQVRLIVDGDRAPLPEGEQKQRRWQVVEGKEGSGTSQREHLLVTVTEAGLTNGLTITTTKRSYYVLCKSVKSSPLRVLRWDYPHEVVAELPEPVPPRPPGLFPYPDELIRYHVGYTLETNTGRPPDWLPRQIVDDGKKLYILYPEVTLFGTVPLVRLIGPNGPQLLNARQYLNVVIIDQLPPRLELRAGLGEGAEVVTITRGKLRTMACPGDGECPMFPRAAHELARRHP